MQIEALTEAGAIRRFTGSYTLRRSVVDGASESQRRWHLYDAEITPCSAGCVDLADGFVAVTRIIHRFGARLRMVSLLGPEDIVASAMREHYAPFITPDLLTRWIDNPAVAPGRQVSSPWPQRIDITAIHRLDDDTRVVRGNIVYVTSADTASAVDQLPVTIRVTRGTEGIWRISDVDL